MRRRKDVGEMGRTILGDEVVVAQAEQVPFPVVAVLSVDRDECQTLPFLVQQPCVLGAAVVEPELAEFAVDVEVEEAAVQGRGDASVQDAGVGCDAAVYRVIGRGFDVGGTGRVGNVENVNVAIDTQT